MVIGAGTFPTHTMILRTFQLHREHTNRADTGDGTKNNCPHPIPSDYSTHLYIWVESKQLWNYCLAV